MERRVEERKTDSRAATTVDPVGDALFKTGCVTADFKSRAVGNGEIGKRDLRWKQREGEERRRHISRIIQ